MPRNSSTDDDGNGILTLPFLVFPWAGFILTCFTFAWINVNVFHHSALASTLCFIVIPLTIKVGFAVRKRSYQSDEVGCGCGFLTIVFFIIFFPVALKVAHKKHAPHHAKKSLTVPAKRH